MRPSTSRLAIVLLGGIVAIGAISVPRSIVAATSQDKPAAKATFEVYKDAAGEYRWRLRAQNTQVIATSGDGYAEKRSCLDAIESVKRNAADAPVKEME